MDRSKLTAYVKDEQDTYANIVREMVNKLLRDDRELQQGGREAVVAICHAIQDAIPGNLDDCLRSLECSPETANKLQKCHQLSCSVLELYQAAAAIEGIFEEVSSPFFSTVSSQP